MTRPSQAPETSQSSREVEKLHLLLYGEHFAPWCEKARWALDHHSITYCYREHVPLAGEWMLRRVSGRYTGIVSVPMLVVGRDVVMDSYAIALKADELGFSSSLLPEDDAAAIRRWNAISETVMQSGRALLLERLAGRADALAEQVPWSVPGRLRPLLVPIARVGLRFVARKYDTATLLPAAETKMEEALQELRAALTLSGYLVGRKFSFADVAMAASLQFIEPVSSRYITLGPATRRAWINEPFRQAFRDLLSWRDEIYQLHRRGSQQSTAGCMQSH